MIALPWGLSEQSVGTWFRVDALGATFLLLVVLLSAAALLYSPAYLTQERYRHEGRGRYYPFLALFVLGMAGALAACHLVAFLVCWEVMTLASYVLVAYEKSDPAATRAAFKYFVMTHVGTACLLLAIMLLWRSSGSFSFDAVRPAFATLAATRPGLLHVTLGLMFVGFATKAGLFPFGDWLPDAHPAAPAPVSALLSGVMVKLGLYGFLRFFVWMLASAAPAVAAEWGRALMIFGAGSAVLGGMAAAAAMDAKVLLAYSSIAQSGLIALGTGAALALLPSHPAAATLAMLGAMFHLVTDAPVKGLLFLNAGSLQYRTGSRRLDAMGGLFQAMPVTGWTALAAALAIAGFPPLTAFVSKWLMLQGTVLSGAQLVVVAGIALLVASLFSILYAVKFFAAAFANRPMRAGHLEVPAPMQAAQLLLAAAVLALGLAPGLWLRALSGMLSRAPALAALPWPAAWGGFALSPASGAYAPLLLLGLGALTCACAVAAVGRERSPRRADTWAGGMPAGPGPVDPHPLGFYSPIRETLRRAYPEMRAPRVPAQGWILPLVNAELWLYRPMLDCGRWASQALRRIHTGVPHVYLIWQLLGAAALALLLLARH